MFLFTSTTQHLKTKGAIEYVSKKFPDGELFVKLKTCVKGKTVTIVHSTCTPVNDNIIELLMLIDALKRGFASHIHVMIPYFGYSRQDRLTNKGTSIPAKVVANLIGNSGVNRLSVLDLHAPQISEFFPIPVHHYSAMSLFSDVIEKKFNHQDTLIVSPDAGGLKRAKVLSELTKLPLMALTKTRNISGAIERIQVQGNPSQKHCLIVDDIIDSGNTLVRATEALLSKGALSVNAFITHAVFSNPVEFTALERLWVTDSIFHKKLPEKVTVLPGAMCL